MAITATVLSAAGTKGEKVVRATLALAFLPYPAWLLPTTGVG